MRKLFLHFATTADGIVSKVALRLGESKTYANGVVNLRYERTTT